MKANRLLVTCEHGGNRVPAPYGSLFDQATAQLSGHEGWDPGALVLARQLARRFGAPLVASTISRLLVDLNRSPHAPSRFSRFTRPLPLEERERIVERYYLPYRDEVATLLERWIREGNRVFHLSVHSFTPVRDGVVRTADVGLLYDPARAAEVDLASRWQSALRAAQPNLRVKRNYPYRGAADGLTSFLRRRHPDGAYAGIELEVNQSRVVEGASAWRQVRRVLVESLRATVRPGIAFSTKKGDLLR